MSIRRERSHRCGHTNIDFRTKNDIDSIKTYMPWKSKREFGTMGNDFYRLPFNEKKKLMKVTENINTIKNVHEDIPDPKYYKTAQFYQLNNMQVKKRAMYSDERLAQLDESFKGKDKYTGESMMIADLTKQRKKREKLKNIQNKIGDEDSLSPEKRKIKRNKLINYIIFNYFLYLL